MSDRWDAYEKVLGSLRKNEAELERLRRALTTSASGSSRLEKSPAPPWKRADVSDPVRGNVAAFVIGAVLGTLLMVVVVLLFGGGG